MKTVKEIAQLAHVSIRTLHHYDTIGLLKPTMVTEAGYRLYDDAALEKLYLILLFREIGFPLKDIQSVLDAPDFDRNRTLERQVELLKAKVTHLQNRIHLANGIKLMGVKYLEFDNWDPKRIDEYQAQAESLYGKSEAWQEYTQKAKGRSKQQEQALGEGVMELFTRLGGLRHLSPEAAEVQAWVKELQSYFTEHFYTCTPQILLGLSEMYAGGGSMTENIDAAGGKGTGEFARAAIAAYCKDLGV
ncbi:MAG: MerR family transcriptional regulator [Oscillospiraceae bacterium]|nr:MerR family transcriptional regulator [Oscillospiraceae bacterium]